MALHGPRPGLSGSSLVMQLECCLSVLANAGYYCFLSVNGEKRGIYVQISKSLNFWFSRTFLNERNILFPFHCSKSVVAICYRKSLFFVWVFNPVVDPEGGFYQSIKSYVEIYRMQRRLVVLIKAPYMKDS